jgi:hypothetical protein
MNYRKQDVFVTKIHDAALRLARTRHYSQLTRAQVAAAAGCSESVVSYHVGAMHALRESIPALARKAGCLKAIHAAPMTALRNSGRRGSTRG